MSEEVNSETLPKQRTEAEQLFNQGMEEYNRENPSRAIEIYQKALEIYQALTDQFWIGRTSNAIGLAYYQRSQLRRQDSEESVQDLEQALSFYQQALSFFRDGKDKQREAATCNNLALVYESLKQYSEAIAAYQQVAILYGELGDKQNEANSLIRIGSVHESLKQYSEAIAVYQQVATLYRELGDIQGEVYALKKNAEFYESLEKYSEAMSSYEQALATSQQTKRDDEIGLIYYKQGQLLLNPGNAAGDKNQALDKLYKALALLFISLFGRALEITNESSLSDSHKRTAFNDTANIAEYIANIAKVVALHVPQEVTTDGQSITVITGPP